MYTYAACHSRVIIVNCLVLLKLAHTQLSNVSGSWLQPSNSYHDHKKQALTKW